MLACLSFAIVRFEYYLGRTNICDHIGKKERRIPSQKFVLPVVLVKGECSFKFLGLQARAQKVNTLEQFCKGA